MKIEHQDVSKKEEFIIWGLALIVGVIAGVIAVCFTKFVGVGSHWVMRLSERYPLSVLVLPLAVYGIHAITNYVLKDDLKFGVQALEHELAEIDHLVMRPRNVVLKIFNTSVALISGFAVGQFGPMLYLGGAIGSNIGYYFKLHKETIRMLIGCGVAAAISATFQMPLFAAVFAIEVIYAKRYFDYMLPLLISSLTAYVLLRLSAVDILFFDFSGLVPMQSFSSGHWVFIASLAVLLGVVSGVYVKSLKYMARMFKQMPAVVKQRTVVVIAMAMGGLYYFVPAAHYFNISNMVNLLDAQGAVITLSILLALRLLLTSVQLGSGIYGGNFSPGLILGILFGLIFYIVMPASMTMQMDVLFVITLSVVGILSGFAHAPISAVILAVESSGEASILFPALVIAMLSHLISDLIAEESVFNLK